MKKTLYIILGAMFIFGILFLLWTWLFSGGKNLNQTNGQFGSSTDSTQNVVGSTDTSNGQANIGQTNIGQNASNGSITLGNNGQNTGAGGNTTVNSNGSNTTSGSASNATTGTGSAVFTTVSPNVAGTQWLSSASGGSGTTVSGNGYNPTSINGINGATVGGTAPTIGGTVSNSTSNGLGLGDALLGAGIAGTVSCALQAGIATFSTAGATAATGGTGVVGSAVALPPGALGAGTGPLIVADYGTRTILAANYTLQASQAARAAGKDNVTFLGCLVNVVAKSVLQQITSSVVNWINSGFNGSPSFVTNYNQFFTNVADLAAGQFIQGSGLAFLCSPFQLQIKIAVAQSYANRGAQSCTLSKVINNVNGFMNGNFSQGGWPGLLSVTTVPTNNPYGAYAYAQIGLVGAQNSALSNAAKSISPTGFLSMSQQTCGLNTTFTDKSNIVTAGQNSQAAQTVCQPGCTCKISTPGSIIEGSLQNTLQSPIQTLGLANDLDQIIGALTTQLITKTLQGGLSNLSGTTGLQNTYQTPDQAAAQAQAQSILTSMQLQTTSAQQYGSILQGSISDIENSQGSLNSLINCWNTAASSTSLTDDQRSTAATNAASAQSTFNSLNAQINGFNNGITQINVELAAIGQLQSEAFSITSTADVQRLAADYNTAQSTQAFIAQADVTTAQQNRATLQSRLASINTSTQSGLAQCQALH